MLAASDVVRFLLFPLAVLLAGAVVTGLWIPALTRRRDDYRKALEVKTGLVAEMSQTVMEFMMHMQLVVVPAAGGTPSQHDASYKKWAVTSAVVGTKLEAYFAHSEVPAGWEALEGHVERLYHIAQDPDRGHQEKCLDKLREELELPPPNDGEAESWQRLSDAVLERKARLIVKVLGTRVEPLETPPLREQLQARVADRRLRSGRRR